MSSQIIPVEEFDYVVFGGTGDLSERKLIPALYRRNAQGQIIGNSRIIAASRSKMNDDDYREFANAALKRFVPEDELDETHKQDFLKRLHYVHVDALSKGGWADLKQLLGSQDRLRAYYLAVGPSLFGAIAAKLDEMGLINEQSRLVIEKPIGNDLESALQLNEIVGEHFSEDQTYRIDHYLGKETVQNLMALRFANALYEPVWNSAHVDHIQITVAESVGVGGRGGYYNKSGAMRDMVQNHMLQLLCMVAMEPPASLDPDAVRDEKIKVLRSLQPIGIDEVSALTVRGQYTQGAANGRPAPSYLEDIEQAQSDTETFVAIKASIENWRWAGVPFYLRTGKRLGERVSEISIQFKPAPHNIFPGKMVDECANRLVIRLQPGEGIKQWVMIKDPGPGGLRLRHVPLDMTFADSFDEKAPDAYERLLLDVVRGNSTLFMRRDEVEAAWRWVDPILEAWRITGQKVHKYTAGSWGPAAAIALIERDQRTWQEDLDF